MNDRFKVIDEPSLSILARFVSQDEALAYVEALLAVNTDDVLDDLTVADGAGPVFHGDALRQELQRRARGRQRVGPRGGSGSEGLGAASSSHAPLAATSHDESEWTHTMRGPGSQPPR